MRPISPLDGGADDKQLRAFWHAFADHVELPTGAAVIDEPVTVVEIAYDGNTRRGLTARCRASHGREHVVTVTSARTSPGWGDV